VKHKSGTSGAKAAAPKKAARNTGNSRTGSVLQDVAGTIFGGPGLASTIAGGVGDTLSSIFGWGAYKVKSNSLAGGGAVSATQVPLMHGNQNYFRIRHREYIQKVSSSVLFDNHKFEVNPGLAGTFPCLSTVAAGFSEWLPLGICFQFQSTCATVMAADIPAMGSVSYASSYNIDDPMFIDMVQVNNNMWTTTAKPSSSFLHMIECDPSLRSIKGLKVRNVDVPAADKKMYDFFNLQVATEGSQSAASVGWLIVEYDILLMKPKIGGGAYSIPGAYYTFGGAVTAAAPFGASQTLINDNVDCVFNNTTKTVMATLLPGHYIASWLCKGAATYTAGNVTFVASGTGVTLHLNDNAYVTATSLDKVSSFSYFEVTEPTVVTLTHAVSSTMTGGSEGHFLLSMVNQYFGETSLTVQKNHVSARPTIIPQVQQNRPVQLSRPNPTSAFDFEAYPQLRDKTASDEDDPPIVIQSRASSVRIPSRLTNS